MTRARSVLRFALVTGVLLGLSASTGHAQGKGHEKHHDQMKHKPGEYVVATDRAIVVTRDVLVRHGYRVVRVQDDGDTRVIWYRAGNHGRGKGRAAQEDGDQAGARSRRVRRYPARLPRRHRHPPPLVARRALDRGATQTGRGSSPLDLEPGPRDLPVQRSSTSPLIPVPCASLSARPSFSCLPRFRRPSRPRPPTRARSSATS